jgi:hypothetical protein
VDRWLVGTQAARLRHAADPLVVDLGYGSSPVTVVELYERLRRVRPDVRVVGVDIDAERVAAAMGAARPPGLTFVRGGFELAGLRPAVVRAMNVLRQYEESAVAGAWSAMLAAMAPAGLLVEGTCDEIGRRCCWFAAEPGLLPAAASYGGAPGGAPGGGPAPGGRVTLTLSAHLASLARPSELAPRLPKALIARNVPGERVHELFAALDAHWDRAAALAPFGPRQRWAAAAGRLARDGWPVLGGARRWRLGELTVGWPAELPANPSVPARHG